MCVGFGLSVLAIQGLSEGVSVVGERAYPRTTRRVSVGVEPACPETRRVCGAGRSAAYSTGHAHGLHSHHQPHALFGAE